jgi:cell division protein FtsB
VQLPRRPGLGRRRPAAGSRRSDRARTPAGVATRPAGLTTRAAALGLVVCALVMSAALPLREYLSQRGRIAQLQQSQQAAQGRVAALEKQRTLLADPTYVASLARERLHYVKPGETTYVVLGPATPPQPVTTEGQAPPGGGSAPWWSQLWGTARSADRAGQ